LNTFERSVAHWRNLGWNKKFLDSDENEYATYENIWDMTEAVLGGSLWIWVPTLKQSERFQQIM
jgi:hypothetical protein